MKTIEKVKGKDVVTEVTCDVCGESCLVNSFVVDNSLRADHRQTMYEFEYIELNNSWGYHSNNKDCESWKAQVCESCTNIHLEPLIIFEKSDYMVGGRIDGEKQDSRRKVLNREVRLKKLLNEDRTPNKSK